MKGADETTVQLVALEPAKSRIAYPAALAPASSKGLKQIPVHSLHPSNPKLSVALSQNNSSPKLFPKLLSGKDGSATVIEKHRTGAGEQGGQATKT